MNAKSSKMFGAMKLDNRILKRKRTSKNAQPLQYPRSTSGEDVLESDSSTVDGNSSKIMSNRKSGTSETTPRSASVGSASSDVIEEVQAVDHEDIVVLTHDVRAFKEALAKLKRLINEKDKSRPLKEAAYQTLGEVLRILRLILEKYPVLQSAELLVAADTLIHQVKEFPYEDEKSQSREFVESVDQLALSFSSRVSEYLMGDLDGTIAMLNSTGSRNKQLHENTTASELEFCSMENRSSGYLDASQMDAVLLQLEQGVEMALHRAKLWSKYAKDMITYVEKRSHLETEFAKNVSKLAQTTRRLLEEESFLPFQSIYITALDQEIENSAMVQSTVALLLGHKFIEPLTARRNEHEKLRKQIKESWQRELKRMQESVNNLRKAKTLYVQKQQDWERAKEAALRAENTADVSEQAKVDKKRKTEDDALQKAMEAEVTYRSCVSEANERHGILVRTKGQVLKQIRELMLQCDQTMKAVTVAYFQLQQSLAAPIPIQFQTLCESSRLYETGSQYMKFIKSMPASSTSTCGPSAPFTFEPYSGESATSVLLERDRKSNNSVLSESSDRGSNLSRIKVWGDGAASSAASVSQVSSDSESTASSAKSREISPVTSPMMPARRLVTLSPGDELENDADVQVDVTSPSEETVRRQCMSKAAVTHSFRKLKTPSRCRECDSYVYFQGTECTECGLASHKKCLETLAIQCGHKRLPRKMTTFGVDLNQHLIETGAHIPHLIAKCIIEIDTRAIDNKGIYRVSGVKSKVEKLCQAFENGADLVDLTDVQPNVVANVLKLYLRQLPEPLLTSKLYPDFVRLARESSTNYVEDLRDLCRQLPRNHFLTLAVIMHHLKRVSSLSSINSMPAANLGIVFGPTLLRTAEGSASLSSLVDTVHQTKVVELLIEHAEEIFGPSESYAIAREPGLPKMPSDRSRTKDIDKDCRRPQDVVLSEQRKLEDCTEKSKDSLNIEHETAENRAEAHVAKVLCRSLPEYEGHEVKVITSSCQGIEVTQQVSAKSVLVQPDSALSSPALAPAHLKLGLGNSVDHGGDSDQSWESQSTGSSGRGTQHSDSWSLSHARRGSQLSSEDHDETDGAEAVRLESSKPSADENLVKIRVPSGVTPPLQQFDESTSPLSSPTAIPSTEEKPQYCVTVLEGQNTTVVDSDTSQVTSAGRNYEETSREFDTSFQAARSVFASAASTNSAGSRKPVARSPRYV